MVLASSMTEGRHAILAAGVFSSMVTLIDLGSDAGLLCYASMTMQSFAMKADA